MANAVKNGFHGYGTIFNLFDNDPHIQTIQIQHNADFVCTKVSGSIFPVGGVTTLQSSNAGILVFVRDMQTGRELMDQPMLWSQFFGCESIQLQAKTAKSLKGTPLIFRAGAVIEITLQKIIGANLPNVTVGFLGTHFYLQPR